jgi:COMPASS component SWD3
MSEVSQDLAILGLSSSATSAEVKAAYRLLAKRWHPDQAQGHQDKQEAEEKFKSISLAYQRLKDYISTQNITESTPLSEARSSTYRTTMQVGRDEFSKQKQAENYYEKGVDFAKDGRYNDAIEEYTRAIKIHPNYIEAYRARGFARSALGLEKTAASDLRKAKIIEFEQAVAKSENSSSSQPYTTEKPSPETTSNSTHRTSSTPPPNRSTASEASSIADILAQTRSINDLQGVAAPWTCTDQWDSNQGYIQAMVASRDGRMLITAGEQQTIQIRSLKKGNLLYEFESYGSVIRELALSQDNHIACGYSNQNKIYIWNISGFWNTGKITLVRTISYGFSARITTISISPDRHLIGIGDESGRVSLWHTKDGELAYLNQDYSQSVLLSLFSVTGQSWITSAESGLIRIRQTDGFRLQQEYKIPHLITTSMAMSPDGQSLIVGGQQGHICLLPQDSRQPVQSFGRHDDRIKNLFFSASQQGIISITASGDIGLWRLHDRALLSRFSPGSPVLTATMTKAGDALFTAEDNGKISCWRSSS